MPRNRRSVEASLEKKGFVRTERDHHYFIYLTKDGRKTTARTKTSHSPKVREIADNLLGQMARQCLLPRGEFLLLADCPMTREDYERKLVSLGEIVETEQDDAGPPEDGGDRWSLIRASPRGSAGRT